MKKAVGLLLCIGLLGCEQQNNDVSEVQAAPKKVVNSIPQFNEATAKQNLVFIKDQYLKMIDHVDNNEHLHFANGCTESDMVCFPRAEEHGEIFMEKAKKWTNGFYPGLLWKLLSANQQIDGFTPAEQEKIFNKAKHYQMALMPETLRGSTHDLGFILYDSFGEALNYDGLSAADRALYQQALATGRDTLATRFSTDHGLIESWDWVPSLPVHYLENGKVIREEKALAEPFTFPVIVDNMMNLEYMLSGKKPAHHEIALSHAKQTYLNHYFYTADDVNKEFPIAYHLYDYDTKLPGNWQGVGNISAWARGQGWSLYGFVTVVEALKLNRSDNSSDMSLPDFEQHIDKSINSIVKLLDGEVIPYWDYFATLPNAAEIAADQDPATVRYSRILDLCDIEISDQILPYVGYAPIKIAKDILAEETLAELATMTSAYNEPFIQGDYVFPCGSAPYKTKATHIPRDTSAAALYASALYRLAEFTEAGPLRDKAVTLADKIMLELTENYLTSKNKAKDYQLGFVLAEATGNLPNASEINTSIVYADFYFLEANMRKLALAKKK